jgi:hypothetical protein
MSGTQLTLEDTQVTWPEVAGAPTVGRLAFYLSNVRMTLPSLTLRNVSIENHAHAIFGQATTLKVRGLSFRAMRRPFTLVGGIFVQARRHIEIYRSSIDVPGNPNDGRPRPAIDIGSGQNQSIRVNLARSSFNGGYNATLIVREGPSDQVTLRASSLRFGPDLGPSGACVLARTVDVRQWRDVRDADGDAPICYRPG